MQFRPKDQNIIDAIELEEDRRLRVRWRVGTTRFKDLIGLVVQVAPQELTDAPQSELELPDKNGSISRIVPLQSWIKEPEDLPDDTDFPTLYLGDDRIMLNMFLAGARNTAYEDGFIPEDNKTIQGLFRSPDASLISDIVTATLPDDNIGDFTVNAFNEWIRFARENPTLELPKPGPPGPVHLV